MANAVAVEPPAGYWRWALLATTAGYGVAVSIGATAIAHCKANQPWASTAISVVGAVRGAATAISEIPEIGGTSAYCACIVELRSVANAIAAEPPA